MGRGPESTESTAERDALYRMIVAATDDLVTAVDGEGRFLYVNDAAARVFGLGAEECVGRSAFDFVEDEDRARTSSAFREWVQRPDERSFTFENRQSAADGPRVFRWTITRHAPGGEDAGGVCFTSIAKDVTAESATRLALKANEVRLRSLLAGMLDAVVTIDPWGTVRDASDSVRALFGYAPEELVGQNVKVLMPEPHHSQHDGYLAHYRATGDIWILNTTRQFDVVHKDGHALECELSVSRIDVPGEEEPMFCGAFRDVSERNRVRRALEHSERRFRAIFDQEYQFVGLLDPSGVMLEVNQAALEASGIGREEAIGKPFWETPWWGQLADTGARLREWVEQVARGEFVRMELDFHTRAGEQRSIDFSLKGMRDEEGRVVLLIAEGRDITELKRAQERETAMLRALATLGESAAILAHEIKNPITSINLALRAVAKELGEDEKEVLEELVTRMQTLEKKLRRTLSFAKPLDLVKQRCDVRELLQGPLTVLGAEAEARGVRLELDAEPACPDAFVDPTLLDEVLTNLVRNALDALDGEGRVRVEARTRAAELVIVIEDDGPGIPASVRQTLFQPFTTTKSQGTGLGLALSRKIVEEHGGTLDAGESGLGGARFTLCLPSTGDARTRS